MPLRWGPVATLQALRARARVLARIRAFFAARDIWEVETPLLYPAASTDPALTSLQSRYQGPGCAGGCTLYLQTSPEFAMKRLLAGGSGSIYQVCKVFRQGELGRQHNPEFTMLELYQAFADYEDMMDLVENLLVHVVDRALGSRNVTFQGTEISFEPPFRRLTYADPEVIHFGIIARTNRGIFAINELPDLAPRIQVGLLNILEERDLQIRGFPVRIPLDLLMVFSANPEDYTNRGTIITPLKDRIGSEIRTHYPTTLEHGVAITAQEAWTERVAGLQLPRYVREVVEGVAVRHLAADRQLGAQVLAELADPADDVVAQLAGGHEEGVGGAQHLPLDPLGDRLPVPEPPLLQPPRPLYHPLLAQLRIVEDDEALHLDAAADEDGNSSVRSRRTIKRIAECVLRFIRNLIFLVSSMALLQLFD